MKNNNYTITHLHSDLSNPIFIDSATKFKAYVDRAVELNMKSIAFTEHGGIYEWVSKKRYCDEKGIKYIHGQEFYITKTLENKVKDNYHICLYAKNLEGVKELNKLSSIAYNKADNHYYYVPRISMDELMNTSNNIIITTACTGGVLARGDEEIKIKLLKFLISNKHRCFLEIQHHNVGQQTEYNKLLYKIHMQTGIPLITGTDTHSLNRLYSEARSVLQKSKNIHFDDEDGWDLTLKSYDELVELYKSQNSMPMNFVYEALNNTNVLAEMVEDFEFDRSNKYPRLYDDSEKVFKQKIQEGIELRKVSTLSREEIEKRVNRVHEEYKVYKSTDTIDYMLFMKTVIEYAHSNKIRQGYGRGSVNGSYIAYLLGITDMDSVKYNLNFFRFLNPQRISLADIDCDFGNADREKIKEFLFNFKNIYCAEIITFNTIALKGAIKDVCRALGYSTDLADDISKNIESKEDYYRDLHPDLFKYVDLLNGVIVSVGTHPSGVLTSPIPIDESMGLCSIKNCDHPVTAIYMKEIDFLNFVKLDILGLDNVDILNRTCDLANIERITPDNLDLNDWKVWESIKEDTTCIFQWESASAQEYIRQLFSDETIKKIKAINPDISYLNLFSIGNGAIRPSGDSFRSELASGVFKDNGFSELNKFLSSTLGYLCYQEQIMKFLVYFCDYSEAESDTVRRAIAKKGGTESLIPEIKRRFIKTMGEKYDVDVEKAEDIIEPFLQIILDSSNYGFSLNHSDPYSCLGYACGWLRYYYPIEFITSSLNVREDKMDKIAKITDYANKMNISIKPIKFRYSRASYFFDRSSNSIYKGIKSIKYLNENVAEELYNLRNNKYESFTDLLIDIVENTGCNKKQIAILIMLDYFEEFGKNQKLMSIFNMFDNRYKKTHIDKTKEKRRQEVLRYELEEVKDVAFPPYIKIKAEVDFLGYAETTIPDMPEDYVLVTDVLIKYPNSHPIVSLYCLKTGSQRGIKVKKDVYAECPFKKGDILRIVEIKDEKKKARINGKWVDTDTTQEFLCLYNLVK